VEGVTPPVNSVASPLSEGAFSIPLHINKKLPTRVGSFLSLCLSYLKNLILLRATINPIRMPITIKIPSIPRPIYLNDSRKASKSILNS
jgi:hypothetical protein